jgi:hypothetical protein
VPTLALGTQVAGDDWRDQLLRRGRGSLVLQDKVCRNIRPHIKQQSLTQILDPTHQQKKRASARKKSSPNKLFSYSKHIFVFRKENGFRKDGFFADASSARANPSTGASTARSYHHRSLASPDLTRRPPPLQIVNAQRTRWVCIRRDNINPFGVQR